MEDVFLIAGLPRSFFPDPNWDVDQFAEDNDPRRGMPADVAEVVRDLDRSSQEDQYVFHGLLARDLQRKDVPELRARVALAIIKRGFDYSSFSNLTNIPDGLPPMIRLAYAKGMKRYLDNHARDEERDFLQEEDVPGLLYFICNPRIEAQPDDQETLKKLLACNREEMDLLVSILAYKPSLLEAVQGELDQRIFEGNHDELSFLSPDRHVLRYRALTVLALRVADQTIPRCLMTLEEATRFSPERFRSEHHRARRWAAFHAGLNLIERMAKARPERKARLIEDLERNWYSDPLWKEAAEQALTRMTGARASCLPLSEEEKLRRVKKRLGLEKNALASG